MKRIPHTRTPNPMQYALVFCILILAAPLFATQARIESMGKRPAFFLDDMTIFENPANATFYSNALIGELGFYDQASRRLNAGNIGSNQDPYTPWFGALFKFGLSEKEMRDPQITVGGVFGRKHWEFMRFVPAKVITAAGDTADIPQSITNFDAFLAGTMIDGSAIGTHVYVGIQDGKFDDSKVDGGSGGRIHPDAHVSILAMDYGANFLITNESSVEVTLGVARIQYGPSRRSFLDPGLFSFYSQGRLFLEMDAWTGQFITGYKIADMEVPGWEENFYDINAGVNVIIPRGMAWFGVDAVRVKEFVSTWEKAEDARGNDYLIYREPASKDPTKNVKDRTDKRGGVLSFGIERNIWGNWLILRTGGQKSFIYETCHNGTGKPTVCATPKGKKGNYWTTNPMGDGSLDDHIGFGIGLNIDEKLKIDANIAEDAIFRNPFTGEGRLISRVSARYSF